MYATVWNRVALLAAGMAVGWNFVNLMVVSQEARRYQMVKVALGAVAGVAVVVALAVSNLAAAIMGTAIFALSGLVAYAGNARHVSNLPPTLPLLQPSRPLKRDTRREVLLVHPGEPETYDGTLPWAKRLVRDQKAGQAVPHWLRQPFLYAHIRAAFETMPPEASIYATLASLSQAVQQRIGSEHQVELGLLTCKPSFIKQLTRAAEDGIVQVAVVPLGLDAIDTELLRDEIRRSRVREVGVRVDILDPQPCPLPDTYGRRFATLQRGHAPADLSVDVAAWTEALADAAR